MLKKLLTLIFMLAIFSANAADSLFVVRDSMLLNKDIIELRTIKWKFHEGKNEKWALKDFDDSSWQEATLEEFEKMKTTANDYCFRLHFKTESSPENPLYIRFRLWIPSLVFLNGKQTNEDKGFNFENYQIDGSNNNPIPIDMYKENVIVVFSDFSTQNFIKNKTFIATPTQVIPEIVTSKPVQTQKNHLLTLYKIHFAILAALALLAFFSWFLVFQDRQVKSLVWIATIISIMLFAKFVDISPWVNTSFALILKDITIHNIVTDGLIRLWVFLIAPVISNIVLNKTERFAKYFFIFSILILQSLDFFTTNPFIYKFGYTFGLFLSLVIIIYIIILFKKNLPKLSKPQWTVIIGLFITLMAGMIAVLIYYYFHSEAATYQLLGFIAYTSFPTSLLIYASLRLRQNFVTIQEKVIQISNLSAEKEKILTEQNETLEKQVEERTKELRASQAQLIQKEKLASLGELTAGIAHEIQNPLNFVNNFSEVSSELVDEMEEELKVGNADIAIEIAGDLKQNLEKINHHGKRASSIVSGMLEHSRTSTGERQLTDINKLADEYLRLSYHGMRAKDSSFSADYEFIADENLPLVNVVPQDIGRVLLNLINNAFYATNVGEVKPAVELLADVKKVIVKTEHTDNELIIKVSDNGTGIPTDILPKIFQPFFTTKPTGEGTGLGLSLAYDIITKGHGGTLTVNSIENQGSEFIITLPIN